MKLYTFLKKAHEEGKLQKHMDESASTEEFISRIVELGNQDGYSVTEEEARTALELDSRKELDKEELNTVIGGWKTLEEYVPEDIALKTIR